MTTTVNQIGITAVTAQVIPFPKKREQLIVRVTRDGDLWLVLTHRGYGWLQSSLDAAIDDAAEIAEGFGVTVRTAI
jgi:hypothetical protein